MAETLGKTSVNRNPNADLFDDTSGYDDDTGIRLLPGLDPDDNRKAVQLYRIFNELMGVAIVVGPPGSGKDTFGNYIAYSIKRYFPQKRIMRDEKPRPLFGEYAGLFNPQVLAEDLNRMKMIAGGGSGIDQRSVLSQASDDWVTKKGQVMLKNALLYLTEFWRYCYCRDPMNPMNTTMGGIHKEKRHLDVLILGTVQLVKDLDKHTCLPFVDWKVTCTKSSTGLGRFTYFVNKVKYDTRKDNLDIIGAPAKIAVDAAKPRSFIGDGRIYIKKEHYQPETEEERIVLDVLRAGYDKYEDIVDLLYEAGDMEEEEVLSTLKDLSFTKRKRAIDYPCYFRIYNSKSAPQINTSLKVSE